MVSVQLTWFDLNVQEELNCLVYDQETAWMVYEHVAVWRFIRWCTNMQWLRRHRWCMNMWWHRRLIHYKIWQSIVISVHWCTHRNLTGNITCLLCFIFFVRAILRFTGVAIGYVRAPDDLPLKMIRGV